MAPSRLHAKPMPESGQEQQSWGLPSAHILPSLLRLLQQGIRPLTAWQDPALDILPSQHVWGQASYPTIPTLSSSTTAAVARDLYKHRSDQNSRPLYVLPAPQHPARSCMAGPPSLSPCLSLCPSLGAVPQAACSCPSTMRCGSLWVFAWLALFLIQVWVLLPPPQQGPPEAASSHYPVALLHFQFLVLLAMALLLLTCPSSIFPAGCRFQKARTITLSLTT